MSAPGRPPPAWQPVTTPAGPARRSGQAEAEERDAGPPGFTSWTDIRPQVRRAALTTLVASLLLFALLLGWPAGARAALVWGAPTPIDRSG